MAGPYAGQYHAETVAHFPLPWPFWSAITLSSNARLDVVRLPGSSSVPKLLIQGSEIESGTQI